MSITNNVSFIDRTEFAKEFINGPKVSVVLRPQRFGKSTNLAMLNSILSIHSNLENLDGLILGNDKEFRDSHFKKYPVVFLSFKDCKGETWDEMGVMIWNLIRNIVLGHLMLCDGLDLNTGKEADFYSTNLPIQFHDVLLMLTLAL